jgi:hypothetical protein
MTRSQLVSEILVVRARGPKDVGRIIDLAVADQLTRTGLAARGSRSPPG